jgi:integrase
MPRLTKSLPTYRLHKASGQAVVTLAGRDIYLGRHNTAESHQRYQQVMAEWLANHRQPPSSSSTGAMPAVSAIDVNGLFVAYWRFCNEHYVNDGRPSRECVNVKIDVREMVTRFGSLSVRDVRPSTLKAVRQAMIDSGLSRMTINGRVNRIRRMFKWGVENDLVEPATLQALQAVAPLRRGRGGIREGSGVRPVPKQHVDAVMAFLPRVVQAMIRVQQYTGMRPGELVLMRARDLDTSSKVWVYRPESHKTEHLGHERLIHIGKRAKRHLRPYLKHDLEAWLFSPLQAMQERWQQRPTHRRQPNHARKTKRRMTDRYTPGSYLRAIYYACDCAFPAPAPLGRQKLPNGKLESTEQWEARLTPQQREALKQWQRDHRWHPHQLRHNTATSLRKQFGVEAARVVLGHRSAAVTEIYAEIDQKKAAEVMGKVG